MFTAVAWAIAVWGLGAIAMIIVGTSTVGRPINAPLLRIAPFVLAIGLALDVALAVAGFMKL